MNPRTGKILRLTSAGLLLALGLLIPQLFHVFGQTAGKIFLPMHLSVLLAGLLLGPGYGFFIGLLTPVLSMLCTGMPQMPTTVFMIAELAVYGLCGGLFYKKRGWNLFLGLLLTQLCGRAAYALTLFVMGTILGLEVPGVFAVVTAAVTGLPGIFLQWLLIPALVFALRKGGVRLDRKLTKSKGHS